MFSEEDFEGMEFLRDTLDVIKPINSNDDLLPLEFLLEFGNPSFTFRILKCLESVPIRQKETNISEFLRVNSDWNCPNMDRSAFILNCIRHRL